MLAKKAGVSVKTIQRALSEIDDLRFVGSGYSGHWEKTGAEGVPQGVPQDVPQGNDLDKWIERQVAVFPNITSEELASQIGVTSKTIKRRIAKMPHIKYVGSGYSGHWEVRKKK